MHPNLNTPNLTLHNAYQQINFYSSSTPNRPLLTRSTGPSNFSGIFSNNHHTNPNNLSVPQQNEIEVCAQPFYVGEVNHEIQEIGLMTVREVRYVCDQEWEQIIRENQRYCTAMRKERVTGVSKVRRVQAKQRERNHKGQFLSKKKQVNKRQKQKQKTVQPPTPKNGKKKRVTNDEDKQQN